jgi:hypothetical protein
MVREATKVFQARCASIRTGLDSTIILKSERQSLAIARSSFTVLLCMSSRARVQRLSYAAVDLSAFDPLPAGFRLGTNGASP